MDVLITKKEAAQILGISLKSIDNWIRHGYIKKIENAFKKEEIEELKRKIEGDEVDRLNKRANKTKSKNQYIPNEIISSKTARKSIFELIQFIKNNEISLNETMFLLSINRFVDNKEIINNEITSLVREDFKRNGVYQHIKEWKSEIDLQKVENKKINFLLDYKLPDERDVLGIIYQSILYEGKKAKLGSYYTPDYIVKEMIEGNINKDSSVLDPCCGTGRFLLSFSDYIEDPKNIYGFDLDRIAIQIAKTNIFLEYPEIDFSPNILNIDSLLLNTKRTMINSTNDYTERFDLIATNPPWGAKYKKEVLSAIKKNFPEIKTNESFSFFLCQAYRFLKDNGVISFLLPEAILNVKHHKEIRRFILRNLKINKIQILGACFKNVLSPVISINMQKNSDTSEYIEIIDKKTSYKIFQDRFSKNENNKFDIFVNNLDLPIFKKIEQLKYKTLSGNAYWGLGIVTGDNKKFLKNSKIKNTEAIFKGADIEPFKLREARHFIEFTPEKFQQTASESIYRAEEKLIYKFISDKLVFAFDNKKSLTLNSANILIPCIEGYSAKIISGFLNSRLYNYYFKKKYHVVKILRGDIEQLPIPILNEKEKQEIEFLIDGIIENKIDIEILNRYIYNFFNIEKAEIEYIEKYFSRKKQFTTTTF